MKTTIISIHAPGKGSDAAFCIGALDEVISIHAPGKGSDSVGSPTAELEA